MSEEITMIESVVTHCDGPDCSVAIAGRDLGIGMRWIRVTMGPGFDALTFHRWQCLEYYAAHEVGKEERYAIDFPPVGR